MVAWELAVMALGVFVLAVGFKLLTADTVNISSLWLANGFALGMLLTMPRARWPLMLAAVTVAGAASAFYLRADPAVIPWIALFNAVEVLVAAWFMQGAIRTVDDLTRRSNFLRFIGVAVVLAPTVMVMLVGAFTYIRERHFDLAVAQRVLIGHAMGIAVMTPVTLALRSGEARKYLKPGVIVEALITLAVVVGVCMLVFFQERLPLLFLIFLPMLRVAYRGGFVGTAVALLVVVAISVIATAGGHGPIAAARANTDLEGYALLNDGFVLLQVFIASLLISLFPMIVFIADGRRAHLVTDELQNRLRLLMEHSSDVIVLTDLDGRRLYVSPAVRAVMGMEPEQFLQLTWRDYVHEDDRLVMGEQTEEAQRLRSSRTLVFRAHHNSGREVWIEAHMNYFRDRAFDLMQVEKDSGLTRNCGPNGDEGFVVTMHDITTRRRIELALEKANAELASLVRLDSLTGLANRRWFDEALADAWAKALAGGWPIAVLMIDVDHFKQYNDCYGHQRGDLCLRDVAAAIASGLFHPDDLAARYGGEEFAVILPRTSTDSAARVAERIRTAVHELHRPHMTAPLGKLTVSIGVAAAHPVSHGNAVAVVTAADEALYISKREGRNRTTLLDVTWPVEAPTAALVETTMASRRAGGPHPP
jgi:diguanylate cyclase (GGDEF)-like protein/PAS domain S-box-containing protein